MINDLTIANATKDHSVHITTFDTSSQREHTRSSIIGIHSNFYQEAIQR